MKRKLFIFILLSMIGLIKVNASNEADARVNLLDMTNLIITDAKIPNHGYGLFVNTVEPITIKPNTNYTLVIDERFYEWDLWQEYFHEWSMNDKEIVVTPTHYVSETYGNWVYATFQSTNNQLILDGIIVHSYLKTDEGYPFKMMLFEGQMDDFKGYFGYGSNFEYQQGYLLLDVDNQLPIEEVKGLVSVEDAKTFNILESTYELNVAKGMYHILYEAYDESLNYAYYQLNVHVVDTTPPVISGKKFYNIEAIHYDLNESDIRSALSIEDNVDGIINNSNLIIKEDTFSGNSEIPGSYHILYEVFDSSNNSATYTVKVNVYDGRGPVFEGPSIIYQNIKDGPVHISHILSLLKANDEIEGETPITLIENNQDLTIGKKTVIFESKDSANNTTRYTFIVVMVDNQAPIFQTSPLILSYEVIKTMSQEDMVSWIQSNIPNALNIEIIHNEALYDKKGNIHFSYELEGVTHYNMISYAPKPTFVLPIIIVSVIVLNMVFLIVYFKKKKY